MTAVLSQVLPVRDGLVVCSEPSLVHDGSRRPVPNGSARLVVLLAFRHGPVPRSWAAGTLWPEASERRAAGNLRTALWRLNAAGLDLVCQQGRDVALRADLTVDVHELLDWTDRVARGECRPADLTVGADVADALDILPGWYDDWLGLERERLRQRVLGALDVVSRLLTAAGRLDDAIDAALLAVGADPLRERAQHALLGAHEAAGNWGDVARAYRSYEAMLRRELGLRPSGQFRRRWAPGVPALLPPL